MNKHVATGKSGALPRNIHGYFFPDQYYRIFNQIIPSTTNRREAEILFVGCADR